MQSQLCYKPSHTHNEEDLKQQKHPIPTKQLHTPYRWWQSLCRQQFARATIMLDSPAKVLSPSFPLFFRLFSFRHILAKHLWERKKTPKKNPITTTYKSPCPHIPWMETHQVLQRSSTVVKLGLTKNGTSSTYLGYQRLQQRKALCCQFLAFLVHLFLQHTWHMTAGHYCTNLTAQSLK